MTEQTPKIETKELTIHNPVDNDDVSQHIFLVTGRDVVDDPSLDGLYTTCAFMIGEDAHLSDEALKSLKEKSSAYEYAENAGADYQIPDELFDKAIDGRVYSKEEFLAVVEEIDKLLKSGDK